MIRGAHYEVVQTHEIDGYHVMRLRWSPGCEQWRCSCPEFQAIRPLTPKVWRGHCEWAVARNPRPRDTA